jgi:hypothetical protein
LENQQCSCLFFKNDCTGYFQTIANRNAEPLADAREPINCKAPTAAINQEELKWGYLRIFSGKMTGAKRLTGIYAKDAAKLC